MSEKEIIQTAIKLKYMGNVSFQQQAREIGIDNSTFSKVIKGKRRLPEKYFTAAAAYYEKTGELL